MSFLLRPARSLRPVALRPLVPRAPAPFPARFASDYGSGKGSPVGENPQSQGKNPRSDLEHPGPSAPKAGQKTNKNGSSSEPSNSSSQSSQSDSSSAQQEGAQSRDADGSSKKGAQPKILGNETAPSSARGRGQSVEEHNREMEGRAEKAHEKVPSEQREKDRVRKAGASE